jgi:hypothetical protein
MYLSWNLDASIYRRSCVSWRTFHYDGLDSRSPATRFDDDDRPTDPGLVIGVGQIRDWFCGLAGPAPGLFVRRSLRGRLPHSGSLSFAKGSHHRSRADSGCCCKRLPHSGSLSFAEGSHHRSRADSGCCCKRYRIKPAFAPRRTRSAGREPFGPRRFYCRSAHLRWKQQLGVRFDHGTDDFERFTMPYRREEWALQRRSSDLFVAFGGPAASTTQMPNVLAEVTTPWPYADVGGASVEPVCPNLSALRFRCHLAC